MIAQGVSLSAPGSYSVELREFGQRAILIHGEEIRPRIAKTYELLAYLASRPTKQATRDEMLDALFASRSDDSSRAYLRQSIHWLRHLLPDGGLLVKRGLVQLGDDVTVACESIRFETQLVEASRSRGDDRLAATLDALVIYGQGDYLPGARSAWACERHERLAELATSARYEAAELALAADRYDQARGLAEQVVSADPFREAAWRLVMRISDRLGDEQGVIRGFQECERALARLGTTPSQSTRQLLERLRR